MKRSWFLAGGSVLFGICIALAVWAGDTPRRATIETTQNETLQGQFDGASSTEVYLRVAGQPIAIQWTTVRYLSFAGRLDSAAALAPPAAPMSNVGDRSRRNTSGRCQATTKKGTQCSRAAQAGSIYCWQHARR